MLSGFFTLWLRCLALAQGLGLVGNVRTNASGELPYSVIPRQNTLASLLALVVTDADSGELCKPTDVPDCIVQLNSSGRGGHKVFFSKGGQIVDYSASSAPNPDAAGGSVIALVYHEDFETDGDLPLPTSIESCYPGALMTITNFSGNELTFSCDYGDVQATGVPAYSQRLCIAAHQAGDANQVGWNTLVTKAL